MDVPPTDEPPVELLSPVDGDALPSTQSVDVPVALLVVVPEPLPTDPEEPDVPYVPDVEPAAPAPALPVDDVPAVLGDEPGGHGFVEPVPELTPLDVPLDVPLVVESVDELLPEPIDDPLPVPIDDPLLAPGMDEPELEPPVCARTGPATRVAANAIASAFVMSYLLGDRCVTQRALGSQDECRRPRPTLALTLVGRLL